MMFVSPLVHYILLVLCLVISCSAVQFSRTARGSKSRSVKKSSHTSISPTNATFRGNEKKLNKCRNGLKPKTKPPFSQPRLSFNNVLRLYFFDGFSLELQLGCYQGLISPFVRFCKEIIVVFIGRLHGAWVCIV